MQFDSLPVIILDKICEKLCLNDIRTLATKASPAVARLVFDGQRDSNTPEWSAAFLRRRIRTQQSPFVVKCALLMCKAMREPMYVWMRGAAIMRLHGTIAKLEEKVDASATSPTSIDSLDLPTNIRELHYLAKTLDTHDHMANQAMALRTDFSDVEEWEMEESKEYGGAVDWFIVKAWKIIDGEHGNDRAVDYLHTGNWMVTFAAEMLTGTG
ncbi:hypothetical protein MFIFM68171_09650 [Madurella fahalii]|uniref:F-box domain-containing protein n=1 Tax=Madurella fahalii TaxID=1157608 RepID=A0ABQ0GNX6_9PEZI